jgi:hypothetical protein
MFERRPDMRIKAFAFGVTMAASGLLLALPASAQRVCEKNCVGPLCNEQCVQQDNRDLTVGRDTREREVIIEERRPVREPGVEIRTPRPNVDVEIR